MFLDLDYHSFHVFSLQEAFIECLLHAGYWTLVVWWMQVFLEMFRNVYMSHTILENNKYPMCTSFPSDETCPFQHRPLNVFIFLDKNLTGMYHRSYFLLTQSGGQWEVAVTSDKHLLNAVGPHSTLWQPLSSPLSRLENWWPRDTRLEGGAAGLCTWCVWLPHTPSAAEGCSVCSRSFASSLRVVMTVMKCAQTQRCLVCSI